MVKQKPDATVSGDTDRPWKTETAKISIGFKDTENAYIFQACAASLALLISPSPSLLLTLCLPQQHPNSTQFHR